MGDDDVYHIPAGVLHEAERRASRVECCISCGSPLDDDAMEMDLPTCAVCGAPQISDAAADWMETEVR